MGVCRWLNGFIPALFMNPQCTFMMPTCNRYRPTARDRSRVGVRRGVVRSDGVERDGVGSGESTTEEVDAAPNESSTTTDTFPEPVDFIDCGSAIPRAYSASAIPVNGHHGIISPSSLQVD